MSRAFMPHADSATLASSRNPRPLQVRKPTARVLIADDHSIFRQALRATLEANPEFAVVGESANATEVVEHARELVPDVCLIDSSLDELDGMTPVRQIAQLGLGIRLLVLAPRGDRAVTVDALRSGARGVVPKGTPTPLLYRSIRRVMHGEVWVDRDAVSHLVDALVAMDRRAPA